MDKTRPLLHDFPRERVIGCQYEDDHGLDVGIVTDVKVTDNGEYVAFFNEDSTEHAFGFRYDWGHYHIDETENVMKVSIPMIDGYTIFGLNPAP